MKRYALPVLISLILSACAAVPRPAFDTELYSHYRETEVTAQRGGVIGYFGARKRGARSECFPAADKHEFRGYTVGTGSVNRKNMELVGRVNAGDKLIVHEIVYFQELPGLWAMATVEPRAGESEGTECIINAAEGLQRHLLLTEEELPAWLAVPEEMRANMMNGKLQVGMTRAHVLIAWGPPYKKAAHRDAAGGITESWTYQKEENRFIYLSFEGDRLVGWRE